MRTLLSSVGYSTFRLVGAPALALAAVVACGGADKPDAFGVSAADNPDGAALDAVRPGAPALPGVSGGSLVEPIVGGACSSQVSAEVFTSALCSCEDMNIAGYLRTESFRSRPAPAGATAELPGSVGVNGDYITAGYADVSGSFSIAGARDIGFAGYLEAGEDVRANPALNVAGVVKVGRDAFLKNDARVLGRVDIGRDLYMEAGADIRGIASVDVGGARRTQLVQIEPPCACAPEQIVDVPALVEAARTDNDNASAGLEPGDLNAVIGIGAELTLPGGRYFIERLAGFGSLTLHVTGKAALFISDDLVTTGAFRVELEPGAELDVFVRDNLVVAGAARFGDPERPSATRIYVGGTGDVAIAGASAFVGNLYAPLANILVGGVGQVKGSLFGKNIVAAGFLDLGYDASIRDEGENCPPGDTADIPRLR